jgi:hypothetical protein
MFHHPRIGHAWRALRPSGALALIAVALVLGTAGCGGDPSYQQVAYCQARVSEAGFKPLTPAYQGAYDRCLLASFGIDPAK